MKTLRHHRFATANKPSASMTSTTPTTLTTPTTWTTPTTSTAPTTRANTSHSSALGKIHFQRPFINYDVILLKQQWHGLFKRK